MTTKSKQKYEKMDQLSHITKRPEMYIGSTSLKNRSEAIASENLKIIFKEVLLSSGFLRVFIEPLSNIIDNNTRSKKTKTPCTEIRVDINKELGEIRFWNDGKHIPIEMHTEEKCYNHTLIFGHLLTSENYDDDEDRYDISGKNGIGVKLSNVFSSEFIVSGLDPVNKKTFYQKWENGMSVVYPPVIKSTNLTNSYTEIRFKPNFKYFGIDGFSDDHIELFRRYIIDTAMITKTPQIYFNGELINIHNLEDYAKLYSDIDTPEIMYIKSTDCEVVLTPANDFQAISFANGISTPLGGIHVDSWCEALFRPILDKLNKPKKPQLTIKDVKKCFRIFITASVIKPTFESQEKRLLEGPIVSVEVKPVHINKICKWSVIERLEDMIRAKEFIALKKTQRKKKGHIKIEGLDPANNEGGKLGHQCTLILVEGLSAKTYAVAGIEVGINGKKGRDWYGIYPLRGKCKNVRDATLESIAINKVVGDIIKSLGVEYGVDYSIDENYYKLRYGRIMILTDQDVDGIHIASLIQNIFHALFPSLLERKKSFIISLQTPLVRVYLKDKKDQLFYDMKSYEIWLENYRKTNNNKIEHKYYKGLGTSNEDSIHDTFGKKIIEFVLDEKTTDTMNKAFRKNKADSRKEWLAQYNPNTPSITWNSFEQEEHKTMTFTNFIDTELIKHSIDNCGRTIPNVLDGLKEGNRKILFACFKRNLRFKGKTLKVAQLAGYVAEHSGYHHGEQNLFDTITGMAGCYIGSNNIPLLYRDGQFGTRIANGKDAANARYIFTKLDELTRLIFRQEDDVLLSYNKDDDEVIEPKYYIPIIPMILVNGCLAGIGTGWSSTIPCYNPIDIISCIKLWLEHNGDIFRADDDDENNIESILPKIIPWYRGFTGIIEETDKKGQYVSRGRLIENNNKQIVNELPVGLATDKFKDFLEDLKIDKKIKNYKNHSKTKTVHFVITPEDKFKCNEKTLKLCENINTSNMVAFTENQQICKFNTVDEIIDYFCGVRYRFYRLRKEHQLKEIKHNISFLGNKKRFLEEVMNEDIKLFEMNDNKRVSRKNCDIVKELEKRNYTKQYGKHEKDEDDEESSNGYNYLLGMQFRSITSEKINKLKNDIDSNIKRHEEIKKVSEKEMWLSDLEEFESVYKKWVENIDKDKESKKKNK